jgi:S1-C subfamily serine protease
MRLNVPHLRPGWFFFTAGLVVACGQLCAAQPQSPDDKSEPAKTVAAPPEQVSNVVENSVVKIFATVRYPDYYKPWTKQAPSELTASGVVIEGKRILSNAHVVLYASQVQVQANQAGDKVSATVVAVAPGIDLAVLKLDDETFFDTHPPLPRASTLPEIKDAVMAYGYPQGGTSLSITKGIVSRIEFARYNLGTAGLRIQIDAAINPGNSGGPAVVGDKMIGLAFSHLASSESIGYIIPCEEINLFLEDIADGHYDGKPAFTDDLQTLENPALRAFLKPGKQAGGIVVHKPDSDDPAYPLKQWDIITKIGDTPVDDEGMIKVNSNLRVMFGYMVQKITSHGKLPLTVIRAGKETSVKLPVQARHPAVIPSLEGAYPSYFVYGPLVFSTATQEFFGGLSAGNHQWLQYLTGTGSALVARWGDKPAFEGEGLVVVSSPFFPHKLSKGYSNPLGQVVKTVNGVRIKNLNHLVEVLRDSKDEFIRFEFDQRNAETLVFPRQQMVAATDEILSDNDLRSQGSPDTMAIWTHAKTSK